MKVKILQGPPASGKTTWSKNFCEKNQDWFRVSRDDFRNMRGKYWIQTDEDIITELERYSIKTALDNNKNVIVDAMNLNPTYLKQLKSFIKECDSTAEISIKKFFVTKDVAIDRDKHRDNSLGEKVIRQIYFKYFPVNTKKLKQDENLPHTIIVDIDGTVAIHTNRGPFEWNKVDTDLPNTPIINIVYNYYNMGYNIIFLSGRSDVCKDLTIKWLDKHIPINEYKLYMRKDGDMRKDNIVKTEIFDKYIRDKYFIEFVLDDRDQVVSMWRNDIGLHCLQVAEGNF